MKKIIFLLICFAGYFISANAQSSVSLGGSKVGYLPTLSSISVLDTLTNTDTTTSVLAIPGSKKTVTWLWNQARISGTVTQSWKIYGGIILSNGTITYTTYAVDSIVSSNNASAVYSKQWTNNAFTHYKIIVLSSGTQSFSQRTSYVYKD